MPGPACGFLWLHRVGSPQVRTPQESPPTLEGQEMGDKDPSSSALSGAAGQGSTSSLMGPQLPLVITNPVAILSVGFSPFPVSLMGLPRVTNKALNPICWASWVVLVVKEPICQCRRHKRCGFNPWVGKIPWKREWQPTPVFLPGESPWTEELGGLLSMGSHRLGLSKSKYSCTKFPCFSICFLEWEPEFNRVTTTSICE